MKFSTILVALASALLALGLVGCGAFDGTTNKLQSIQLSTSNSTETPGSDLDLVGIGGTKQLYVWGNYSSGKQKLLNSVGGVLFQIAITPGSQVLSDSGYVPLTALPPDTVDLSPNGLLTAVPPFACTWINLAVPPATSPAWAVAGSYTLTATYSGFTTPPVFVELASAAGIVDTTNPNGACGPDQ